MPAFDKIVLVTRKTALEDLVERHNTRDQARFYLEHMGASFDEYQAAHDAYQRAFETLRAALPDGVRSQFVDRGFVPVFSFGPQDLVVTLGPDGLVVNTAKYLTVQPILALNPDPQRVDGILVPFPVEQAQRALRHTLESRARIGEISMAQAALNDGQSLLAVNDLFVGARTHVSARYRLRFRRAAEDQSSSGIIISTGAGSTGWFRSILTGAAAVVQGFDPQGELALVDEAFARRYRFDWSADHLYFSVREPFVSKTSAAGMAFGRIEAGEQLEVTSHMPQDGVIFSDGIEADYLPFNSGAIATIALAERKVRLVTGL